jgi:UDP-glucose 4-epimerase
MKALVTGGAGFIGSHICQRLLKEGYEVICLDNFDPYYSPNLKRRNIEPLLTTGEFKLIEGDIRNRELMQETVSRDIDYIFHYAAQAGVRASVENPIKPNEVNTTGLLNILQAACLNSRVRKIINASSSSVYGETQYLPFDEAHPKMPISPYGISKLAAEHYCRLFSKVYGLNTTSLRLFTAYGPKMRPDLAISIFTSKALKNETVEIFGDGNKTRDFTHIDDIVEANLLAIGKGDGEIYNIGSGGKVSINELAQKILKITASKSKVIHVESQRGDVDHTWANIDKAEKELGWKPKVNFERGLVTYVERIRYELPSS